MIDNVEDVVPVEDYMYLGVHIDKGLKCKTNTDTVYKRRDVQQRWLGAAGFSLPAAQSLQVRFTVSKRKLQPALTQTNQSAPSKQAG